ncbi:hypothetical protein [Hymenobacter sp. YC55]|uniref:hypothetical protein n=1 Tax=Hymenobacter sp. YC55 TaxID=3034019 RepID=UPI0023F6316A|nr:hypothetical protein [Hymenobacter sp. YC55]MDF7810522.1 hypothetical protein [Hymenobacter sp. YC55]
MAVLLTLKGINPKDFIVLFIDRINHIPNWVMEIGPKFRFVDSKGSPSDAFMSNEANSGNEPLRFSWLHSDPGKADEANASYDSFNKGFEAMMRKEFSEYIESSEIRDFRLLG